jgi:aspartyl-tRNA(Asn)/glutamyl-tRNA(Gln) amidotransferase subunit C
MEAPKSFLLEAAGGRMKIEDLQETADLAHLNMDEKELAGAFPAFEQMLGYFAAMQAADKDEAAFAVGNAALGNSVFSNAVPGNSAAGNPAANVADSGSAVSAAVSRTVASGHFRPDNLDSNNNASDKLNENLLNNAGERDGRFVVVPNVL